MDEIRSGAPVYDEAGYEYTYKQKIEDGHLVNKIIEVQITNYRQDDFSSEYIDGEAIILREVFIRPPKAKVEKEIFELAKEIGGLRCVKKDVEKELLAARLAVKNCKADLEREIKKYPSHNEILKFMKQDVFFAIYKTGEETYISEDKSCKLVVAKGSLGTSVKYTLVSHWEDKEAVLYNTCGEAERALIEFYEKGEEFPSVDMLVQLYGKYDREKPEKLLQAIEEDGLKRKQKIKSKIAAALVKSAACDGEIGLLEAELAVLEGE